MSAPLQDYVSAVAEALDDYQLYTAAAGSGAGTLIISNLIDNPLSNASNTRFDGAHVTNLTQGNGARVIPGGYAASTGTLTLAPAITPVAGDAIVLTWLFPFFGGTDTAAEASYRRLTNASLKRITLLDQILLPIAPGQTSYPISPWQYWFDREERFGWPDKLLPDGSTQPQAKITEPGPFPGAVSVPADWRRPRLLFDADVPYLEIEAPFAPGTTGNLGVRVQRPADSWVAKAGAGIWIEVPAGVTPAGLVAAGDLARPPVADVREVALEEAYRALMNRGANAPSGVSWRQKWLAQRQIARGVHGYDASSDRSGELAQPTSGASAAQVAALSGAA